MNQRSCLPAAPLSGWSDDHLMHSTNWWMTHRWPATKVMHQNPQPVTCCVYVAQSMYLMPLTLYADATVSCLIDAANQTAQSVVPPASQPAADPWSCNNLTSGATCTTPCSTGYTGPGFISTCSLGNWSAATGSCNPSSVDAFNDFNILVNCQQHKQSSCNAGTDMSAGHVTDDAGCILGKPGTHAPACFA